MKRGREKTHVARPILRLCGELARLKVKNGKVVHVADDDELKAVNGGAKLEGKKGRVSLERRESEESYAPSPL
jgi:methyl coenzyme M reductase subunit D